MCWHVYLFRKFTKFFFPLVLIGLADWKGLFRLIRSLHLLVFPWAWELLRVSLSQTFGDYYLEYDWKRRFISLIEPWNAVERNVDLGIFGHGKIEMPTDWLIDWLIDYFFIHSSRTRWGETPHATEVELWDISYVLREISPRVMTKVNKKKFICSHSSQWQANLQ